MFAVETRDTHQTAIRKSSTNLAFQAANDINREVRPETLSTGIRIQTSGVEAAEAADIGHMVVLGYN